MYDIIFFWSEVSQSAECLLGRVHDVEKAIFVLLFLVEVTQVGGD